MFQKSLTVLTILILSITTVVYADSTKTTMAVFGIRAIGIDKDVATLISERIESRLVQLNRYDIISRSDIALILKESVFQQTGTCIEEECAVKAGTLLGAHLIVTGSLSKLGSTYSVVLKSISVQNGTILISANRTFTGSIELLFSMVDNMVTEMFAKNSSSIPVIVIVPEIKPPIKTIQTQSVQSIPLTSSKESICCASHEHDAITPHAVDSCRTAKSRTANKNSMLLGYGALCLLSAISAVVLINQTVSP